jgi:hypothetical protein
MISVLHDEAWEERMGEWQNREEVQKDRMFSCAIFRPARVMVALTWNTVTRYD